MGRTNVCLQVTVSDFTSNRLKSAMILSLNQNDIQQNFSSLSFIQLCRGKANMILKRLFYYLICQQLCRGIFNIISLSVCQQLCRGIFNIISLSICQLLCRGIFNIISLSICQLLCRGNAK